MRYMFMMATCYRCGKLFGSNPERVPTVKDARGEKQPLCAECVAFIQETQRKMNLPVWPDPLPGAYEPVDTYGDADINAHEEW